MKLVILSFVFITIVAGVSWSLWKLLTSALKIHESLDSLKERAKSAKTRGDLKIVWGELLEVNKECWHKSFYSKVVEIKTIIETKYDYV